MKEEKYKKIITVNGVEVVIWKKFKGIQNEGHWVWGWEINVGEKHIKDDEEPTFKEMEEHTQDVASEYLNEICSLNQS